MSEKISDIKLVFEQAKMDEYPELYKKYESDSRAGVKNLIRKYQKQEEKLEQERARLEQMQNMSIVMLPVNGFVGLMKLAEDLWQVRL